MSNSFLFADPNWPFLAAAVVTLIIAAMEAVSLMLGLGLSEAIDSVMPDVDLDLDADLDADVDAGLDTGNIDGSSAGVIARAFGWLNVGRVPVLVLLICFLGLFALVGFALQLMADAALGLLPAVLAGPVAGAIALPATRTASRLLARVVPREETYAVGGSQLVGRVATVSLGPVRRRTPGKAKVADEHGNLHFVRVRAANRKDRHEVGAPVLLVGLEGAVFEVIAAPPHLIGDQSETT
jgi:hypothetical protein